MFELLADGSLQDLSPETIRWMIFAVVILLIAVCVHEWGHAYMADRLGDPTPRSQGRVSLNPAKHADPIGTLAFPVLGLIFSKGAGLGFGWGKPVMVTPNRFSRRFRMRTAHLFVALAGPVMNLILGTVIAIIHVALLKFDVVSHAGPMSRLGVVYYAIPHNVSEILTYAAVLNFILFFFNLIPAPPLDGGTVLEGLLPRRHLPTYQRLAVYGPFLLMAVIFVPGLSRVFVWPATKCTEGLYKLLASVFL